MTTLIPAPSACVSRTTASRQRPAERLEQTSDDIRRDALQRDGCAWSDIAVLFTDARRQRQPPLEVRKRTGEYNPAANVIQIMTMKVSKGLEFPVVALPGVGHVPAKGEDDEKAARVFYAASTWAPQRLAVGGWRETR